MTSNSPQRPDDGRPRREDATFQLPSEELEDAVVEPADPTLSGTIMEDAASLQDSLPIEPPSTDDALTEDAPVNPDATVRFDELVDAMEEEPTTAAPSSGSSPDFDRTINGESDEPAQSVDEASHGHDHTVMAMFESPTDVPGLVRSAPPAPDNFDKTVTVPLDGDSSGNDAGDPDLALRPAGQGGFAHDATVPENDARLLDHQQTMPGDGLVSPRAAGGKEDLLDRTIVTPDEIDPDASYQQTINLKSLTEEEREHVESALAPATGSKFTSTPFLLSEGMEAEMVLRLRMVTGSDGNPDNPADYRINKVLGEGGMGMVYLAEQMSLDRLVALKVIKPIPAAEYQRLQSSNRLRMHEKVRRDQFLSEALVTGALDHPNIVPIHDVGHTADGAPFYSMKRVEGRSWRDVISKNSLEDNLDILMKVSDAVGFAHARGVIHRDIKPENVMLGEFGVVMLMDWGLALVTPRFQKFEKLRQASGFGGSPAYMAPEMTGRVDELTPTADIYLLGATLFEMLTGLPPHPRPSEELSGWASVRKYLDEVVKANVISEVDPRHQGELLDIALKAMATRPQDRYQTTTEFQTAIRQYRSHAESQTLSQRAGEDLERARETKDYADFSRALFGYEQSVHLWNGNRAAVSGLSNTRHQYAEAALSKEDYDLGLSLLDEADISNLPLISRLKSGQKERSSRARRLKLARITTMGLSLLLIAGGLFSIRLIAEATEAREATVLAIEQKEKTEAEAKQTVEVAQTRVKEADQQATEALERATQLAIKADESLKQTAEAEKQTALAVMAREAAVKESDKARAEAETARQLAIQERKAADEATLLARAEEYVSQIGLARTRIEQNEFEDARRILQTVRDRAPAGKPMEWEWKWLWRQCHQSLDSLNVPAAGRDVTSTSQPGHMQVAFSGGGLQALDVTSTGQLQAGEEQSPIPDEPATLSVSSPEGTWRAVAGPDGVIRIHTASQGEPVLLHGHAPGSVIHRLLVIGPNRLLSASDDQTVRLWDVASGTELAQAWHIAPVRDVAAINTADGLVMVTAVRDLRGGAVVVWHWNPTRGSRFEQRGEFSGHGGPVTAVALSSDGQTVASGDIRGRVLIWNINSVSRQRTRDALLRAVQVMQSGTSSIPPATATETSTQELFDRSTGPGLRLVSNSRSRVAHQDEVTRIEFSQDGQRLLTTSADYTIKLWSVPDVQWVKTLRGHGGGVAAAIFFGDNDDHVLSTGADRTVRTWTTSADQLTPEYRPEADSELDPSKLQAHHDEIWSASFDSTGQRILTAGRDHSARIITFDPKTSTFRTMGELNENENANSARKQLVEGARWVAFSMAVRKDGRRLYVADTEGFVRVWDMPRAVELGSIPGTGRNFALALSDDGRTLLTGSEDPQICSRLWQLDANGLPTGPPRDLSGPIGLLTSVAISPDGSRLFTGTLKQTSGTGTIWDATTGAALATIPRLNSRVNDSQFSPDGQFLFLGSDDGSVLQYSLPRQEVVRTFPLSGYVTDIALSPDGHRLLTINMNDTAQGARSRLTLWTVPADDAPAVPVVMADANALKRNTPNVEDEILSANFSPDGQSAISVHRSHNRRDSLVRFWNLTGDQPESGRTLRFPQAIPAADLATIILDASRQPRMLSLHLDSVFQWNLETLSHELSYRQAAAITEAAFSPDGSQILTASRSVVLWDAASQKALGKLEFPHQGAVTSLCWDPQNSGRFATAGKDGMVKIWSMGNVALNQKAVIEWNAGSPVERVRWSKQGTVLAVCADGRVRVWNIDQPEAAPQIFIAEAGSPLLCGEFSPKGDMIIAGSQTGIAYVWKLSSEPQADQTGQQPWARLRGHADAIEAVGFLTNPDDPDGSLRYLTASRDKSARLWAIQDVSHLSQEEPVRVREVLALRKHDLGVTAVQASPDGRTLMTASLDGRVILWPTEDPAP